MNSVELKDKINEMVLECRSIVDNCKKEQREMDEEEKKRFDCFYIRRTALNNIARMMFAVPGDRQFQKMGKHFVPGGFNKRLRSFRIV